MTSIKNILLASLATFTTLAVSAIPAYAEDFAKSSTSLEQLSAPNVLTPAAGYTSAGQPSKSDISVLKELGYNRVVDLRGLDENRGFDEATAVLASGMEYQALPISGQSDINFESARQLHELLGDNADDTFVHCGSGNRVGALMALRAYEFEGASLEEAIEIGKSAGMTRLEGEVRSKLIEAEGTH